LRPVRSQTGLGAGTRQVNESNRLFSEVIFRLETQRRFVHALNSWMGPSCGSIRGVIAVPTLLANDPNSVSTAMVCQSPREAVGHAQPPHCYVPVPLSATVCGLAPPLSSTSSVALFEPLCFGVNR